VPIAQSNVLNTNAAGETSAVFPGGIELTESVAAGGIFTPPAAERRVRWVKEASGALVAELFVQEFGTTMDRLYLTQGSELLSTEQQVRIRAANAADAPFDNTTLLDLTGLSIERRSVASMPGGTSSVKAVAEGTLRNVIDHNGGSDFLQYNSIQTKRMQGPWLTSPPPLFTGSADGAFTVPATGTYLIMVSPTAYTSIAPVANGSVYVYVNGTGYTTPARSILTYNASQHMTLPTAYLTVFLTKSSVHWIGLMTDGSITSSDSNDWANVLIM
jgi:hypothetical protein